jgi:rod shape-determining protein MreC
MAPPSPRRPGFSRRAQYGIFASYVIAVVGVLLALLLVITARFDPEGHSALQSTAADLTAPISRAGRSIVMTVDDGLESISAYFDAASKNKAMSQELTAARQKLVQADVLRVENARLRALMDIQSPKIAPVASAELVSSTGASSRRYAVLAAGAQSGIANGQPVIGPEGLVGRIVATGQTSSRVLLITDAGNVTPVKRAKDGATALAIGLGDGRLILRPLLSNSPPFRPGDMFVTSGSGGIYRPDIPVAHAINHGREGTLARPAADPARLDFALVEPVYQTAPPAVPSALPDKEAR